MKLLNSVLVFFAAMVNPLLASEKNHDQCQHLSQATFENLSISQAKIVAKDALLPSYCKIQGVVDGTINVEMRLPLTNWNGNFLMVGCGGFCGQVLADKTGCSNSINVALQRH